MSEDIGEITKCYTVTYRRRSQHSPARLWRAITDPREISIWMGAPATVDLRAGGDYLVDFHGNGEDGLDGIIVRVDPERRLGYLWGRSYVEWEIEAAGAGCEYIFVHTGLTDRGEDEEGLPAGWHNFFERLDDHLAGVTRASDEHAARWKALKPAYRAQIDAIVRGRIPRIMPAPERTERGSESQSRGTRRPRRG
jgi:uncharacterized protein YndB with AHSA1/START domain